jgi:hypothetical protein
MSYTVNGPSCDYVSLSKYNSSSAGTLGNPTYMKASDVVGHYVVPNYSSIGYNALTHGNTSPSCSGYFSINSAYGPNAANCNTQYMNSPCNQ